MDIIQYINENAILLDNHLEQRLIFPEAPTRLMEALRYGVIGGGKKSEHLCAWQPAKPMVSNAKIFFLWRVESK